MCLQLEYSLQAFLVRLDCKVGGRRWRTTNELKQALQIIAEMAVAQQFLNGKSVSFGTLSSTLMYKQFAVNHSNLSNLSIK